MKKKLSFYAILTILAASVSAQAATGLEGHYKFNGYECSSGTKPTNEAYGFSIIHSDVSATFTSNQLISNISVTSKMNSEQAQVCIKQFEENIASAQQFPDSLEKQKYLEEINKGIKAIKKMLQGTSCTSTSVISYSVSGNRIHTKLISTSGTCSSSDDQTTESDSEFILAGNLLKLNSPSSKACPTNDMVYVVYERVK